MKVVIIGGGNVATVYGRKMLGAGHEIIQVVGRSLENVSLISSILNAAYTVNLLEISTLADIYIISVSDNAISSIASKLKLNNKVVVHTAGAVQKDVLASCTDKYGVLYPIQTLRKERTEIPEIPILVDASSDDTREFLLAFASTWSDNVQVGADDERLKLHVAAVFVNNFTNHLFAVSEVFCKKNGLSYSSLRPLIKETMLGVGYGSPLDLQTGPAVRRDFNTINRHKKLLEDAPHMLQLYNELTNSILSLYAKL